MIAGNKCDLKEKRQVSETEGRDFALDNNLLWMETSAKTATNVDEMFITLISSIKQKLRDKMTNNEKKQKKTKKIISVFIVFITCIYIFVNDNYDNKLQI